MSTEFKRRLNQQQSTLLYGGQVLQIELNTCFSKNFKTHSNHGPFTPFTCHVHRTFIVCSQLKFPGHMQHFFFFFSRGSKHDLTTFTLRVSVYRNRINVENQRNKTGVTLRSCGNFKVMCSQSFGFCWLDSTSFNCKRNSFE